MSEVLTLKKEEREWWHQLLKFASIIITLEKAHWNRFCDSISLYPTHFVMIWCKLTLFVTSDPRAKDKTD